MFEPDVESEVWRNLQGHKVTVWKLFSSCGVHFVRFQNLHIFMLVEKRYPLTPATITDMLNKKLQADYWNEMCYQLLKLMTKLSYVQDISPIQRSHIQYALTKNPTIYVSFIKQFCRTATARTSANGEVELTATIDGQVKTITEASLRRHLKLEDNGGVTTLPNSEIFEQLALMGIPKKTAWEQFSSNIATAIICLATNRTYNFSKLIFDAMIKNLENPHKFLMYPRFLQICFNKQRRLLGPHTRTYVAHTLTQKLFSNMKRISKGYSGVDIPLFPTMISAPETSPSRITSSPSLSPQHTPVSTPSTSQPPNTQPTPNAEEAVPMPHESPLHSVHSLGRDEGSVSLNELTDLCTSLSKKVGALENELQQTKKTYKDEEDVEDSSKQGRKILNIYEDLNISLPTELVEDIRSGEKGSSEVSTANIAVTTAEVSTAAENLVYIRRSAEKKKDKGKGIMTEPEPKKKTKKQLEQERLRHEEAVRLQEQLNEKET
ncbi:hypothetical protein Tco_1447941 [Tanacetum coccineum]